VNLGGCRIVRGGVEIESETPGEGAIAERGTTVVVRLDGYLNRGQRFQSGEVVTIELGCRHVIAGLEYGIEGMRVGGRRRLRIGSHLAYRDEGVPGKIPPNALLIYDVELLSVAAALTRRPS
jgi:FKBP-type peptidyl-prolyl cis-trans isomerase